MEPQGSHLSVLCSLQNHCTSTRATPDKPCSHLLCRTAAPASLHVGGCSRPSSRGREGFAERPLETPGVSWSRARAQLCLVCTRTNLDALHRVITHQLLQGMQTASNGTSSSNETSCPTSKVTYLAAMDQNPVRLSDRGYMCSRDIRG